MVGTAGNPGQANYAAAKAGLQGLSKSLAQEVASRGITVNCVAPGLVETAMTAPMLKQPEMVEMIKKSNPMAVEGYAQPEEIADLAVYLAGATYTTGQAYNIDGGWTI